MPETYDPLKDPEAKRRPAYGILSVIGPHTQSRPVPFVAKLGIATFMQPTTEAFRPYRKRAASFRKATCRALADVAGGVCGPGPSSMVATASIELAVSRYLYDMAMTTDMPDMRILKEARQQGDSSRQNLLAAYELAVREAGRRGKGDVDPLDLIEAKQRAAAKEAGLAHAADCLG